MIKIHPAFISKIFGFLRFPKLCLVYVHESGFRNSILSAITDSLWQFLYLAHWSIAPDIPILFMGKLRWISFGDSSNCWLRNVVEQELCHFIAINSICVYFRRPTCRWRDWRTWRRARFCSSRRCPGRLSALRPSPPSVRNSRLSGHFLLLFLYFIESSEGATIKTPFQILAKILVFLIHRKIKLSSVSIQKGYEMFFSLPLTFQLDEWWTSTDFVKIFYNMFRIFCKIKKLSRSSNYVPDVNLQPNIIIFL